ncbi:hypothetical protein [Oryzomonas rubra]|uniref:Uncharacterized protein n=1 Tax=Oryzomonas rubra TaxID=2509454 RepID=A0A5A9XN29_9BACT|nr:hypothetical protein [Oryzomonas rubra]KAA0894260.1 hypothetical protein ET418_04720 [Oryzomonas rubra]
MEKYTRVIILILTLVLLFLAAPATSEVIRIVPGPLDGCKIMTPWGDYIAVQQGSTIWVGTEAEYERARISSILGNMGMKEVQLEGISGPNVHAIISTNQPSMPVGGVQLYQIESQILFGVGPSKKLHRPPKPADTEYVSVTWLQSKKAAITPRLYDLEEKKSLKPFKTEMIGGLHNSEFMVARAAATHKVGLIFAHNKSTPGYLQLASLSQAHYKSIMDSVQESQRLKTPVYKTQVADLAALHELDSSIPAELDSSIPIKDEIDYDKLPNKGCPMKTNSKGKKVSDRQLDGIYVGMSESEVLNRFGPPTHCTPQDDGSIWYWWKRSSGKGGESMVDFDPRGIVMSTGGDAD